MTQPTHANSARSFRSPILASYILPTILIIALGLLTTVAVAWSLAAWLPHDNLLRRRNVISQPDAKNPGKFLPVYVTVYQFSRRGMIRLDWHPGLVSQSSLSNDLTARSTLALKLPTVNQDRSWGQLPRILHEPSYAKISAGGQDARGWPFLALWCNIDEVAPSGHSVRGGIALSPASTTTGHARALPYLPIFRGAILNTLIYSGAWTLIILIARRIRAILRRRRGHCPRCNFNLAGDIAAGCPECGWRRPSQ